MIWVLCQCEQCEKEFIAKFSDNAPKNPDNLYGLQPEPTFLACPYCRHIGVSVAHFPEVKL